MEQEKEDREEENEEEKEVETIGEKEDGRPRRVNEGISEGKKRRRGRERRERGEKGGSERKGGRNKEGRNEGWRKSGKKKGKLKRMAWEGKAGNIGGGQLVRNAVWMPDICGTVLK